LIVSSEKLVAAYVRPIDVLPTPCRARPGHAMPRLALPRKIKEFRA